MEQSLWARLADAQTRLTHWLVEYAYPIWWRAGADHERGGFVERLDLAGNPTDDDRRFRVQPRQTYCYSMASAFDWHGPAEDAVMHGWDYSERVYLRPDGLFGTLADATGNLCDHTADLYDQAFAVLAYASIARALPQRADAAKNTADDLLNRLLKFRHPGGGFFEISSPSAPLRSNPHMHLFEAAMAWDELESRSRWTAVCDEIASLCLSRFIPYEGAGLREFFASDWSVMPDSTGAVIEPGHQFEWAWLLERWGKRTGRSDVRIAARSLFTKGDSIGVDLVRRMAVAAVDEVGAPRDSVARLWPQTERLKAALLLADSADIPSERAAYLTSADEACSALLRFLDVRVPGLWRDKCLPDGNFVDEPAPASSFYHIVCAIAELSRAITTAQRSPSALATADSD